MNGSGSGNDGFNAYNPVDKFEEAFMSCLSALTKEDTLTNVDRDEIRVDVEQGIYNVIDSARIMEAYFLKKRLEISAQKPELLIKDDANELRLELIRKDELLKKNYEKINHWQSILSDVQAVTAGKQVTPGPVGNQQSIGHTPTGLSQQLSQAPHTPQGPMTPTGGRPNTPGAAGRPQTPGGSGGIRMQTSTNLGYQHPIPQIGSPQIGQNSGLQEINAGSPGSGGGRKPQFSKKGCAGTNEELTSDDSIVPLNSSKLEREEDESTHAFTGSTSEKRKWEDDIPTQAKKSRKQPNKPHKKDCQKNHISLLESMALEALNATSPYNTVNNSNNLEYVEDSPGETITVAVVVHNGPS